jgi:hypothetical protein
VKGLAANRRQRHRLAASQYLDKSSFFCRNGFGLAYIDIGKARHTARVQMNLGLPYSTP